jgi:hypothetical protein
MRKWGIIISAFYALILLVLIVPGAGLLIDAKSYGWPQFFRDMREAYRAWLLWIPIGILLVSQSLLLFLSVDTSQKRLKPRANILVSCVIGGILTALLTSAVISSLGVTIRGDKWLEVLDLDSDNGFAAHVLIAWGVLWLLWGIVFYLYLRNSSGVVDRIISWLLKGSVLELLIAVPCHIIVRRRHDCSAPLATGFGIATGVAIMLLSFGPSVLFLVQKAPRRLPPALFRLGSGRQVWQVLPCPLRLLSRSMPCRFH